MNPNKCILTCTTVAVLLFGAAQNSKASIIVDAYGQNVHAHADDPYGDSSNGGYAPGPQSTDTSNPWGYASITSSSYSASRIDMNYSFWSPSGGFYGHQAYADQIVYFHVDAAAGYTESLSNTTQTLVLPYAAQEKLWSYLSEPAVTSFYYDINYAGIPLSHSGVLIPGIGYLYYAQASQLGNHDQTTVGSAHFSISSSVPEPSSLVLMGLGGIGLAMGVIRRRH